MAYVPVTITAREGKRFRLLALTVCPDTATVYTAEFSDSLPGAVGLARLVAMLRMLTGHPVELTVTAEVRDEGMQRVIAGGNPCTRYDGRDRCEPGGGKAADEPL